MDVISPMHMVYISENKGVPVIYDTEPNKKINAVQVLIEKSFFFLSFFVAHINILSRGLSLIFITHQEPYLNHHFRHTGMKNACLAWSY